MADDVRILPPGTTQVTPTPPLTGLSGDPKNPVPGVSGVNSVGGDGVFGSSGTGAGVHGETVTGPAVHGLSQRGLAGLFDGSVKINGDLTVKSITGDLTVNNITMKGTMTVASGGDILLSDCAEYFEVSAADPIDPGTVMAINEHGGLEPSRHGYDRRVAGVVSGAGDYRPAIVLGKVQADNNAVSVALLGKAYCKVDAEYAPIDVGDLLTSSDTPGHAMRATDPTRAFGAVIGKALRPLQSGQGLVPILIALQ